MAQGQEEQARSEELEVTDHQPSSPAGSTSSREERNARERLKKASITGLSQKALNEENEPTSEDTLQLDSIDPVNTGNNGIRGRPAKKRSFEDLAKDDAETNDSNSLDQPPLPKSGHHKRMRSRDIASGDHSNAYNKIEGDLNETLHEETDIEAQKSPGGPGVLVDVPSQEEMEKDVTSHTEENLTSSTTDEQSLSTSTKPISTSTQASGFANTSAASPFGRAKSPVSETLSSKPAEATSSSAFASSGLSAFASSENSPFGSTSPKPLSSFGGGSTTGGFGSSKGGFGSTSGFSSSSTTGFGSGGGGSTFGISRISASGFGTPKPFGSSSVISGGSGTNSFGTAKPFGVSSAKDDEDENGGNEEDEASSNTVNEDTKQDPRFHDQHGKSCCHPRESSKSDSIVVDTGEEDEEVHFSARAKLYVFAGKDGWKDRGTGVFKINVRITSNETTEGNNDDDVESQTKSTTKSGKRRARLLMRADATHRVILNSPIFKGMRFGNTDGSEPTGKLMHLQSLEEGKPLPLQIRVCSSSTTISFPRPYRHWT